MHILPSGRLPRSVVPKRYDLTLAVEPKQGKFSGAVSIDLEIHEATPTIILHAVDLQITQALFEGAGLGRSAEISLLPESEVAVFTFPQELPAGPGLLKIEFDGRLNKQMKGLYAAKTDGE